MDKIDKLESEKKNIIIGVLALQGAFREHIIAIKKCQAEAIEVRFPEQLQNTDGLIIPGGESTTISKLIEKYNFKPKLIEYYNSGKPIFGTCAGLILLAKEVTGFNFGLGFIDISVTRNSYGRQVDSFEQEIDINLNGKIEKFNAVFIRAPKIEKVGNSLQVLAKLNNDIVLAKQNNVLVCAFHPELTDNLRIHKYFLNMVKNSQNMLKSNINWI